MTLKNNLYSVVAAPAEGQPAIYRISLNKDCFIYKAHFPGMPITPGVCLTQIVEELAEDRLASDLELVKVNNVKFLNVVSPIDNHELDVELTKITPEDSDRVKIQAAIKDATTTFAKISATYTQSHPA